MSWYQYLSIVQDSRTMARQEEHYRKFPVACPNDGEPLRTGPDGFLFCSWGDWRPDGAPPIPES